MSQSRPGASRCSTAWDAGARHKPIAAAVLALLVTAMIALATGYVLVSREKDRADLRSRQARRAVDEMYTQVAERWLADEPRMQQIQREFLEKAMRFYQEFAASGPVIPPSAAAWDWPSGVSVISNQD